MGELLVFSLGRRLLVDNEELSTSFLILHIMIVFVAYVLELIFLIFFRVSDSLLPQSFQSMLKHVCFNMLLITFSVEPGFYSFPLSCRSFCSYSLSNIFLC